MLTATTRVKGTPLGGVLATTAALGAAAGGLIHLAQIGSHLDFPFIAGGFALMGGAQWAFALTVLLRSSRPVLITGGILHAAILALWLVTRTVGLVFVTGAELPADIGVADVVANTFSLAVVGVTAIGTALHKAASPVVLPPAVATRIKAVVLASAIFLTVPALLAPHDHGTHPLDAPTHQSIHSDDHASDPTSPVGEHDPVHSNSSTDPTLATQP